MELFEVKTYTAPFVVRHKTTGETATVSGFSQNDPLGVGGGFFPDMPTVYFEGGGWLLLNDFLKNYDFVMEVRT